MGFVRCVSGADVLIVEWRKTKRVWCVLSMETIPISAVLSSQRNAVA